MAKKEDLRQVKTMSLPSSAGPKLITTGGEDRKLKKGSSEIKNKSLKTVK